MQTSKEDVQSTTSTPPKGLQDSSSTSSPSNGSGRSQTGLKRPIFDILDSLSSPKKSRSQTFPINMDRVDLIAARATIITLENKLRMSEQVIAENQILYDSNIKKIQDKSWWDKVEIRDLRKSLTTVRERETALQEEHFNLQHKFDVLKLSTDVNVERIENCMADLKINYSFERMKLRDDIAKRKQKMFELKGVLNILNQKEELQDSLIKDLKKQAAEKLQVSNTLDIKTLELNNARSEICSLKYLKDNYELYQQQIKTHDKKLHGYPVLEKENNQLKEDVKNLRELIKGKLLLEEQVHNLTTRLKKYEQQEVEFQTLKAKQFHSDHCLNEWREMANTLCNTNVPDEVIPVTLRNTIETLQKHEVNLTADKVGLESKLSSAVHESQLTATELEKTNKQFAALQKTCEESQELIKNLQNKFKLVSSERDSYKAQLESYEKEFTMKLSQRIGYRARQGDLEQIKNLNTIIDEYRSVVKKLEDDLKNAKPIESNQPYIDKIILLESEINKLKVQNSHLRERRDALEVHLEKLADMGLTVDYTKHEGYQALLKEVDQLKAKISTQQQEFTALNVKYEDGMESFKKQVEHANTLEDKAKAFCRKTLDNYRQVVYNLFGYRIASGAVNTYSLTSMFARSPDQQLCFDVVNDGVMNLLENEYSLSLVHYVDIHLRQQNSIPMFLSAVTLDAFHKQNRRPIVTETVEIDDDSNDSYAAPSEAHSSRISIHDSSDKSSEDSAKRSNSYSSDGSSDS